jgi:ABC-type nitrate/sulfonate/bicarbonate transport system permease component
MRRIDGEVPFRAGGFAPRTHPWAGAATLIGLILLWQAASSAGLIPHLFLPSPWAVAVELVQLAVSGQLWVQLQASLLRLVVGWGLGTAAGLVVGMAAGLFTLARSPSLSVVSAFFPIPKIALVPLFIIWFGIGEGSKIVTVGLGVFFPTVIATVGAVDGVPRNLIRMGQSFGLSRLAIVRKIVLPGALPGILTGFRVTAAIGIILLVAAEMIGAERGIGAFVLAAGNLYDMPALLAGIVVLSALGLLVAWAIGRLERALLGWR